MGGAALTGWLFPAMIPPMSMQRKNSLYPDAVLAKLTAEVEEQLQKAPSDLGIRHGLKKKFHRDGIREITNGFERLLSEVFMKVLRSSQSRAVGMPGLRKMLEKLENHYDAVRTDGASAKTAVEREFFQHAYRSLWHLFTMRNWVAHEARQTSQDDYVECLRAFEIALQWYCTIFSDTQSVWLIPVDVEGVYLLETETSRIIQIPRSVIRLKSEFERAYLQEDYAGLKELLHPEFQGVRLEYFTNRDVMIDTIRNFHKGIGGASGMLFILDFKGFEMDDDGTLWWLIQFIFQKDDIARDVKILQARLSDLRSETARILMLRPFEQK